MQGSKSIVGNDQSIMELGDDDATDPYCPSVGATPLEDIPLIVKSSQEFPARSGGSS